jgi:hypothetical protein
LDLLEIRLALAHVPVGLFLPLAVLLVRFSKGPEGKLKKTNDDICRQAPSVKKQ